MDINSAKKMKELSEYTDKELRQELYRRSKKNKIAKEIKKCFNCKNRICYSEACRLEKRNKLPFKLNHFGYRSICLKRCGKESYNKDEHLQVNKNMLGCDLFKNKNYE